MRKTPAKESATPMPSRTIRQRSAAKRMPPPSSNKFARNQNRSTARRRESASLKSWVTTRKPIKRVETASLRKKGHQRRRPASATSAPSIFCRFPVAAMGSLWPGRARRPDRPFGIAHGSGGSKPEARLPRTIFLQKSAPRKKGPSHLAARSAIDVSSSLACPSVRTMAETRPKNKVPRLP